MKISFIKETAIYFMPLLVQAFIIPLSLFFYSKVLSPGDYGILGLITVTSALILIFSNWGLINGMIRFLGEPNEDKNKLIGTAYYGSLIAGLTIFSVFCFGSSFLARIILGSITYKDIFILGVSTVIFGMAFQSFQNFLRMQKMAVSYVTFEIANILCGFGLGVYFVYFLKLGIFGVVLATFIAQVILMIVQYLYFKSNYKFGFSWQYFKKLILYGAPFTIIIIGTWMLDSSDRYILKLFVSMNDLGIYNVAYSYGLLIQSFVSPFILAVLPYLFEFYRKGQYSEKTGSLALYYTIFYTGIILVATFLAKPYFLILTPSQFHFAVRIAPLISLCYAWRGLFNIFCFCNTLTGNAKAQFFIEISAAILNIVLNFVLIPFLGLYGAAYATIISWLWMLIFAFNYNQKILPINLPRRQIYQVLGFGLICYCGISVLNNYSVWPLGLLLLFLYALFIHHKIYSLTPLAKLVYLKFSNGFQVS